ncbi:MAG: ABC transporter permease subunit [Gammaproteobacteria bacterium]|nr:ABC transporter permease subunit [Gammaproteobacteria bacterium]
MSQPYHLGDPLAISLSVSALPVYALFTVMRMFIALFLSLVVTIIFGTLAAKNASAERIIIPALDILQSVPVLSFLSISIMGFIHLFPGSMLGPECACIFAIFTAQFGNMTFSLYQSLKTVPTELSDTVTALQLSAWQRFWKLEIPFAMSGLIWNMMISMSSSWFFVVVSEAINVAHQDIRLPGIGSYIALAIESSNLPALGYAILTMLCVIFFYDQVFFRPLITWSEKFKLHPTTSEEVYSSWVIDCIRRSQLLKRGFYPLTLLKERLLHGQWINRWFKWAARPRKPHREKKTSWIWSGCMIFIFVYAAWKLGYYIFTTLPAATIFHVILLGAATSARVLILIVLSSLIWIPIGVWIGLRPRWAQRAQPIIQFAAAFPANLFYPLCVIGILRFHLNVEIWVTPLMILGTQWYILFNVIAGASQMPRDLYLVANNFGLKGVIWWKRLGLPAIYPYFITGAITAAGGAWNASIVSEWVSWGDVTLKATGLGAYIQANTIEGHFNEIALGTCVMCLYVVAFNHLLWRPLYHFAQTRFAMPSS